MFSFGYYHSGFYLCVLAIFVHIILGILQVVKYCYWLPKYAIQLACPSVGFHDDCILDNPS